MAVLVSDEDEDVDEGLVEVEEVEAGWLGVETVFAGIGL